MSKQVFYKGKNNGLEGAVLYERDVAGDLAAFNLTGATSITVQLLDNSNTVVASFTGSGIAPLSNGEFTARPDSDDLNSCTTNTTYYYQIVVVNSTYPQGRVWGLDENDKRLQCIVI